MISVQRRADLGPRSTWMGGEGKKGVIGKTTVPDVDRRHLLKQVAEAKLVPIEKMGLLKGGVGNWGLMSCKGGEHLFK